MAKPAPADAAWTSFESAEVLLRLLTKHSQWVADLARISKRAQPNLLRTLGKMEALGLIETTASGNRRIPTSKIKPLSVTIDPIR
ncbi:hypothetical protein [Devosia sp.]|uniref:hypothetical protein n=1 Tax=Devosia sp. TaxID=1871048 RepID=UPI0019ECAEA3|nr:hypothetical protein [Devosia sp.]MBE0578749.1 hypothetical protein [Devosia sp.]